MKVNNSPSVESQELVRSIIQRIAVGPDRGRDIDFSEAKRFAEYLLAGQIDEVQIGVVLIALRMKRESMDEFAGLLAALQADIETKQANLEELFCLADPFDGYLRTNTITPFIPAVMAACGQSSLMHGVASVGPKHGVTAHKVLALAGVQTLASVEQVIENLERANWAYCDQAIYAPPLHALQGIRERIVKRSALTTLERLLMPVRATGKTHMVLGYVHRAYPEIYAEMARQLGYDSALLVKGVEGGLAPALNKPLRQYLIVADAKNHVDEHKQVIDLPYDIASDSAAQPLDAAGSAAAQACLDQGLAVLGGQRGWARNSLCLAVSQLMWAHNKANSFQAAVEKVQNSLDNGSAMASFKQLTLV